MGPRADGASTGTTCSTRLEPILLRRSGRSDEAKAAYGRALELATNPAEQRFLERRLTGT